MAGKSGYLGIKMQPHSQLRFHAVDQNLRALHQFSTAAYSPPGP